MPEPTMTHEPHCNDRCVHYLAGESVSGVAPDVPHREPVGRNSPSQGGVTDSPAPEPGADAAWEAARHPLAGLPAITDAVLDQWQNSAEYDMERGEPWATNPAAILAVIHELRESRAALAQPPTAAPLDAMARDLGDVVRRAPDAFCDLTGARHADLVERRALLAILAGDHKTGEPG